LLLSCSASRRGTHGKPAVVTDLFSKAARYQAVDLISAPGRDDAEIERFISNLGDKPAQALQAEQFLRKCL
jgi:hypothetical protein